jgi:fatty-acyl-CoA synthase
VLGGDDVEVPWDGRTTGEICVRSNHVMAGYWQAPDATAAALRGGWLRTGDVATVSPDGYLTIVDRTKDLIVSGGENISGVEIEKVLAEHPAVLESAVVGAPDDRWGEVPRAYVVLRPGCDARPEELREHVRSRLARFKAPRDVILLAELPRTGTGKVSKPALRARRDPF